MPIVRILTVLLALEGYSSRGSRGYDSGYRGGASAENAEDSPRDRRQYTSTRAAYEAGEAFGSAADYELDSSSRYARRGGAGEWERGPRDRAIPRSGAASTNWRDRDSAAAAGAGAGSGSARDNGGTRGGDRERYYGSEWEYRGEHEEWQAPKRERSDYASARPRSEYYRDRADYAGGGGERGLRSGGRDRERDMRAASDEPEWLSAGPSTTDEQIELRGMSDEEKENDGSARQPQASRPKPSAATTSSGSERRPGTSSTNADARSEKDAKTPEQISAQLLQQTVPDTDENDAEGPECMSLINCITYLLY